MNVSFLEFVTRLAFTRKRDRLSCSENTMVRLEKKYHPKSKKRAAKQGSEPDRNQKSKWRKSIREGESELDLFDQGTFAYGMLANDFQEELINIALFRRDQL